MTLVLLTVIINNLHTIYGNYVNEILIKGHQIVKKHINATLGRDKTLIQKI